MIDDHVFAGAEAATGALSEAVAACLGAAIAARGAASIAVSGGRTPEHLFPKLARARLDWARVTVTLIDDRWVAPDHADSNQGLARRLLLQGPASAARFVGLCTDDASPQAGLAEVERRLDGLAWPLDAALLGMGSDGHVASLFPDDAANWRSAPGRAHAVPAAPGRLARMSLSPAALADFRDLFLLFGGSEKRAVFEAAKTPGAATEMPVRLIVHQSRAPLAVYGY